MDGKTLLPISIVTNGNMSGNITSTVVPLQYEDNVGIQLVWTGSPVGTFAVQVSLDQINWIDLPSTAFNGTYPVPGTTSSPAYLDMALMSAAYIRLSYTSTSGTGTLNALLVAKGV